MMIMNPAVCIQHTSWFQKLMLGENFQVHLEYAVEVERQDVRYAERRYAYSKGFKTKEQALQHAERIKQQVNGDVNEFYPKDF